MPVSMGAGVAVTSGTGVLTACVTSCPLAADDGVGGVVVGSATEPQAVARTVRTISTLERVHPLFPTSPSLAISDPLQALQVGGFE